ncbi:MAG: cupin domain-containing protein [Caldilineaceae bacterium]|nr:cupin domain-containing protein [Caldilineaceae bacterium]MCB0121273.1 cupin domain-containing protein [Caldilineaceae bacterium]MCB0184689.1 cupin domain-containing protein [Caldilineaceae bacterium]
MRAQALIEALNLRPLNMESGFFNVVYISTHEINAADGPSRASNCIYYMLTQEAPQNNLHWVWSDDYQILIEGGPADFYLFYADGRAEKQTMGRNVANGEQLIIPCPGETYKAILLHDDAEFLLTGSVVTPAWNPQRARIGGGQSFLERYRDCAPWATPAFLRRLIGPNWESFEGADGQPLTLTIDASGQVLWKNMQLTEEQLAIELRAYATAYPQQPLVVKSAIAGSSAALTVVRSLAAAVGLELLFVP